MADILLEDVYLDFPLSYGKSIRTEFIDKFIKKNDQFPYYSALKDININLKEGDKVGLLGPNGSGKTSLLKIISRIYHPNNGKVIVNGSILTLISLTTGLDLEMDGVENIYLTSYLRGYKKKEIDEKITQIIEFSELGESIYKPTRTYSSGMLTRLAASIIISFDSDILILDEFISTGDKDFKNKLFKYMISKIQNSKIVIFSSHDEEMIDRFCNIKVFMENGSIKKIEKI